MRDSITTALNGVSAWTKGQLARLQDRLEQQIIAAKNTALAADRKISACGSALRNLGERIDGVARVPVPGLADIRKALMVVGSGSYGLSAAPVLTELRPIRHVMLQEAVSKIYVDSSDTGAALWLPEISIQVYAPAEESVIRSFSVKQLICSIYAKPENDNTIHRFNVFPLLTGAETGFGFAIGYINMLSGDCWVARGSESTINEASIAYPISATHYIGPIGLDALKQNTNMSLRVLNETWRIKGVELTVTGLGSELPAGTEILIRGR